MSVCCRYTWSAPVRREAEGERRGWAEILAGARAVFFPGSKPPKARPFIRATGYGVSWYNDLTEEERRWRTPNDEQCEEITNWHMTRMFERLERERREARGRIVGALRRRGEGMPQR
jgi:hypothetical protein